MMMSGEAFDCRILVRDQTLELGESYDLPVAFLAGDQVTAKLSPGVAITLWEGKNIAGGSVIEVIRK